MEASKALSVTEDLNILQENSISNDFYVVGYFKLAILFSCTLGLYLPYWFYRQWKQQKIVTGLDCLPVIRGIFLIFFIHTLFEIVDKKLRLIGKNYDWNPRYTAGLLGVLVLGSSALDRLAIKEIGLPYTDLFGWVILAAIGILLIYVQRIINIVCDDEDGKSNCRFSALNYLWVAFGIVLMVLYLIGSALPPS